MRGSLFVGALALHLMNLTLGHAAEEIVLEAEAGKLTSPMAVETDPAVPGGKFVHVPRPATSRSMSPSPAEQKACVELTVTIDEPGAYTVEALTDWPRTTESGPGYGYDQNAFAYTVDGLEETLPLGYDAEFNVWKWREMEPVYFTRGPHVIHFFGRKYHARLDKVRIRPADRAEAKLASPSPGVPAWAHYELLLLDSMRKLVQDTIQRDQGFNSDDDQCLFLSYWLPYYRITGDEQARRYMYQWRDAFLRDMDANKGGYYHGFSEVGELHHQVENHQRFLGHLWQLDRNDANNIRVLEDAAEHIGNWVEGIPAWYDWPHHRYVSWYIGTKAEKVQQARTNGLSSYGPDAPIAVMDGLRPVTVALNAHAATGKDRYLQFARDYVGHLCPELAADGWRVSGLQRQSLESSLLDLAEATGDRRYLDWTRELLQAALTGKVVPADRVAEFPRLWRYRRLSGDTRFDQAIMEYAQRVSSAHYPPSVFMVMQGLGTDDMELPYPVTFALAGQIGGKEEYSAKALAVACEHVEGARAALASGRPAFTDRGDHNRATWMLWHSLNGVYPLLGLRPGFWGQEVGGFDLAFRHGQQTGLPEGVAALNRSSTASERVVSLYNTRSEPVSVGVIPGCLQGRKVATATTDSGEKLPVARDADEKNRIDIALPSRREVSTRITLE
jgi:hypothetical protein